MTTSGTSTHNFDLMDLIEEAYEQAGLPLLQGGNDLKSAHRSLDLITAEWANRGLNLWTLEEGSINLTPGTVSYALPEDTVDLTDYYIRTDSGNQVSQKDIRLTRIGPGAYAAISNKLSQGRPNSIFIERFRDAPIVRVWPVPDGQETYSLVYFRLRRIQDASASGSRVYSNTMDAPFRFIPALVAGLAYRVAMKRSNDLNRIQLLKSVYDEQFEMAASEDATRTEIRIYPDVGYARR